MKTQKAKLYFEKESIIQLTDTQIDEIRGGSWTDIIIRIATYGTWIDHGPI